MKTTYIILILILIYSCKKDENLDDNSNESYSQNRINHPLNDSLVSNYLYQPGTWWVYKDLTDNSRDSIYVYNTLENTYVISVMGGIHQGTTYHDFERYEMILGGNVHETNRYYLISNSFKLHFNEWETINIFSYDENTDSTVLYYNRVAFYDSLEIQNNWYYNVAKTKIYTYYHSCCPIPDLDYYYISKEFGIIKKEIANPIDSTYKIYELVNSNIVK